MARMEGWRGWAAAGLALGLGLAMSRLDWPKEQRLRDHGVRADGWVTAKDLHGGKSVSYAFNAGGKVRTGTGRAGYGNPEFSELSAGDRVLVFYLPKDPEVSTLGDPEEHLKSQNLALLVLVLGVVGATVFLVRREIKKAAAPKPTELA